MKDDYADKSWLYKQPPNLSGTLLEILLAAVAGMAFAMLMIHAGMWFA